MNPADLFVELAEFMRQALSPKTVTVLEPRWDPTYGPQDPVERELSVVEYEDLCKAIDDFGKHLREKNK